MIGMIVAFDGDEFADQSTFEIGALASVWFEETGALSYEHTQSGVGLQGQQIRGI